MRFLKGLTAQRGVQLNSASGSSSSDSASSRTSRSDYSDESYEQDSRQNKTYNAPPSRFGQSGSGCAMRPLSARSNGSANGSFGRRSPPAGNLPQRATPVSQLSRTYSGGGLPIGVTGGTLVAMKRSVATTGPQGGRTLVPVGTGSSPKPPAVYQRSPNASIAFSNYLANAALDKKATMNILVLGAPQVGKSTFINAYRAAVTNSLKWPTAPVGICGFYGTTSVEPFPNHPTDPSWMLIDTPGRLYTHEYEAYVEKLVEGMPWKAKLAGARSMGLTEVKDLTPIAANAAHQCVVVVPATDLIEDNGWTSLLRWSDRYVPAGDAKEVVLYTKGLVSLLRALLKDASPFLLITKMDLVGGANCTAARETVLKLLSQCVPANRIFFTAFPESSTAISSMRNLTLDECTRESLVQMHEEICFAVQWKRRMDDL